MIEVLVGQIERIVGMYVYKGFLNETKQYKIILRVCSTKCMYQEA